MLVRAICAHISPDGKYRNEGDKFDHAGKLYKHVEKVKANEPEPEGDATGPEEN
jgi:hypothetical protein